MNETSRPRAAWQGAAPLTWVGDFVRAYDALSPDAEASIAMLRMLGFDARLPTAAPAISTVADAGPAAPAPAPATPAPQPPRPPPAPRAAALSTRLYSECRQSAAATTEQPAAPPWLAEQPALDMAPRAPRAPAPLFGALRRRSILTELLGQRVCDGAPDVAAIVRELAQGRALRTLPRRPRRTLAFGVELVLDGADSMQPWRADSAGLADTLRHLLPGDRLQVTHVQGRPGGLRTRLPRSAVLAVTDFGAGFRHSGPRPAPVAAWVEHAARLAAADRPLRALVPLPAPRWPAALLRRRPVVPVVAWAESTTLGEVRRALVAHPPMTAVGAAQRQPQRDQAALELATLLSPALRIEPALLRQARRCGLPAAGPQAEADLWFGPLVASRGPAGITLTRNAAAMLSERLAQQPAARQLSMALLETMAAERPQSLQIEQALQHAASGDTPDDETIERLLRPAFKSLADGGAAAQAVAAWVPQAWQRLAPALRASAPARRLALAASVHLGSGGWLQMPAAQVTAGDAMGWLLPAGAAQRQDWRAELRACDEGEQVLRFSRDAVPSLAVHRIELPASEPLWIGIAALDEVPPLLRWTAVRPGLEVACGPTGLSLDTLDGRRYAVAPAPPGGALASVLYIADQWLGVALTDDLALMAALAPLADGTHGLLATTFRSALDDAALGAGRFLAALDETDDAIWLVQFAPGSLRAVDAERVHQAGAPPMQVLAHWDGRQVSIRDSTAAPSARVQIEIAEARADGWSFLLPAAPPGPSRQTKAAASRPAPPPQAARRPIAALRAPALALRRERYWTCRIAAAPGSSWLAREVHDQLVKRGMDDWRVRWPPLLREPLTGQLRPDLLVIVGAEPPDAAALELVLSGLPVLWAPMTPDPQAALARWPDAARARIDERQWLRSALDDRLDAGAVATEIAHWSAGGQTPAPAAPGTAPVSASVGTPPAPATSGWWPALTARARRSLVELMEDKLQPGLHRVPLDGEFRFEAYDEAGAGTAAALLLLHGEGSNARAAFAPLWDAPAAAELRRLHDAYGHALAFEYRSISHGVSDNVDTLASRLPTGCRLHIVAHGGGGLLAELLCLETSLNVEHIVRIAAPLRGMASLAKSLERMSSVGSAVGLVLPFVPVSMVSEQLQQIVKDPDSSPGLADLMPGSALVARLDGTASPRRLGSRLTVIAGEPANVTLLGTLRRYITSALTPADARSDGAVGLAENFGGIEREAGLQFLIDRGPDVTHFNYLKNAATRVAIVDALLGAGVPALRHAASYAEALRALGLPEPAGTAGAEVA